MDTEALYADFWARTRDRPGYRTWGWSVATAATTEYGELVIRGVDGGALEILSAEPVIAISMTLTRMWEQFGPPPNVGWADGILTLRGRNRTVSYGVIGKDEPRSIWVAVKSPEVDA